MLKEFPVFTGEKLFQVNVYILARIEALLSNQPNGNLKGTRLDKTKFPRQALVTSAMSVKKCVVSDYCDERECPYN